MFSMYFSCSLLDRTLRKRVTKKASISTVSLVCLFPKNLLVFFLFCFFFRNIVIGRKKKKIPFEIIPSAKPCSSSETLHSSQVRADLAEPITAGQRAIDGQAPPIWLPVIQSAVLSQVKPALNFSALPPKKREKPTKPVLSVWGHLVLSYPALAAQHCKEDGSDFQYQLESPVRPSEMSQEHDK